MLDELNKRQPMLKYGVVFLYNNIDTETFPELVASLVEAKENANGKPVRLLITSYGGLTDVSLASYAFIKGFGGVNTYLFGTASSGAVAVFAAGEERFTTPFGAIGLHSTYASGFGNLDSKAHLLGYERSKILDDQFADIMAGISKRDKNWWKQALQKGISDICYNIQAEELVAMGVAQNAKPEDYIFTRPPAAPAAAQHLPVPQPPVVSTGQADGPTGAPKSD